MLSWLSMVLNYGTKVDDMVLNLTSLDVSDRRPMMVLDNDFGWLEYLKDSK
jgi:hypothetical protein